jgi:hypothetical protein
MSGLTQIGGLVALFSIVWLALFFLHRYLFEAHIKKNLSLKNEGEDDMENKSSQFKSRYSIERFEKLVATVEEMQKSHEEMRKKLMRFEESKIE